MPVAYYHSFSVNLQLLAYLCAVRLLKQPTVNLTYSPNLYFMKSFFRQILLLLLSFMATGAFASQFPFAGSGTSADPYLLTKGADIKALADACAGEAGATSGMNASHCEGLYFAIANDIDMAGINDFYGIGTAPMGSASGVSWFFAGQIDGRNHTIRNMNISGIMYDASGAALSTGKTGSRAYVGFVGTLKNGGKVMNLHFDNTCVVKGASSTGTVAGQAEAGCYISNCTSEATVFNLKKNSGGIVGQLKGTTATPAFLFNCVFNGKIYESSEASGGIAGRNERGVVSKCVNLGDVNCQSFDTSIPKEKQNLGAGIVGYNYFGTVENCMNAGTVFVSYQKAGGIVAYNSNADCAVTNCINIGRISTPDAKYIGAIVGHNFKSGSGASEKYATISGCYYDAQMWGDANLMAGYQVLDSCQKALPTAEFTSGNALAGIPAAHWTYEAGFYPRVNTTLLSEKIKDAAACYVVFNASQNAMDFSLPAKISSALPSVTARMKVGRWFEINNGFINPIEPTETVNDTIEISCDRYVKLVPVMNVPVVFSGAGTADNPYLIGSKKELYALAERCNSDRMEHFANIHFRQTADISFEGDDSFKGIASKNINAFNSERSYYFSGHYDGGGFKISGLDIEGVKFNSEGIAFDYTAGSTGNVGLFGALGSGALIENINIESSRISGYYNVGGIAGYLADNSEIRNCHVNAAIVSYNRGAGGIAGSSEAASGSVSLKITGCTFSGTVVANSENAGGIIGYNHAVVADCANLGDVAVSNFNECTAPKNIGCGGIAGSNLGNIDGCLNMGNIDCSWSQAGGIAGYNSNGYRKGNITRCVSVGEVNAADATYAGSMVGLDYRIATSQSSRVDFSANYFDKSVCGLGASENTDKPGFTVLTTESLTSGSLIKPLAEKFSFVKGFIPTPKALANVDRVKRAAATYINISAPAALYNFGNEATVATTMNVASALAEPSDIFSVAGGKITAKMPTDIAEAYIILTNGDYSRRLKLTKLGNILAGEGSEENPYLIATPADFNKLSAFVRANRVDFAGYHFRLTADLDFSKTFFIPLGFFGAPFNGCIDGEKHKIAGIVCDERGSEDPSAIGLLSWLGQSGTVKNLTIARSTFAGESFVGAFAGHCLGSIENCTTDKDVNVSATIAGSNPGTNSGNEAGGIAGRAYSTSSFLNCVSKASVSANKMAGGIVGSSRDELGARIVNCRNEGTVVATAPRESSIQGGQEVLNYVEAMAGGIAGRFTGSIVSSSNAGEVSTEVCNAVGGILGKAFIHTELRGCTNEGTVKSGYAYGGGIVGITSVTTGSEIHTIVDSCVNRGSVVGMTSLGGIAGVGANGSQFSFCSNSGNVAPNLGRAGGIVGEISQNVSISDSYNVGEISASMLAGGIAGDSPAKTKLTINRCFNSGNIKVGNNGGCSGIVNVTGGESTIENCFNTGNVEGAKFLGGIAGRSENANIARCYSTGRISCTSTSAANLKSLGSIVGDPSGKPTLTNCCYLQRDTALYADSQVNGIAGMNAAEIWNSSHILGSGYIYSGLCFPRLKDLAELDASKAACAYFELSEGDSEWNVLKEIELCDLSGVAWSSEGPLEIKNDMAYPASVASPTVAYLTAHAGDFSKRHQLLISVEGGIEGIDTSDLERIEYYSLQGVKIESPRSGEILVRTVVTSSGERRSAIVIAR